VAALAGLALGRFAFLVPDDSATPPPARGTVPAELAEAERAVAADPENLPALQALGLAATNAAIASGDPALYALAGDAFERADALAPDDPETLVGRGKLALSLHDFAGALTLGERAVSARPDHAASLGVVVDAQVELGDYEAAATTLQRMLDVRPDLAALSRTSYLRELHGDLDGAALALRQAGAAGSRSPLDQAVLATLEGDLALRRGEVAAAADAYDRAAALLPDLPAVPAGRARVLAASGDLDGALALLEQAADRRPSTALLLLQADLLRLAGRDREADGTVRLVRASADLARAAGQVVDLEIARFEADHGDPERAIELARAAHDARPGNVFAADALAWALHSAGDDAAALPLVERSLRLGGADPGMQARAALVFAAAGDEARAREHLSLAFRGSPLTAIAQYREARALAESLGVVPPPAWRVW
jgi:tetratricopeptide (TPR) repeat protein